MAEKIQVKNEPLKIPNYIPCLHCQQMLDTVEFYPNYNQYMKYKKMPFCKKCSKEIVHSIFKTCNGFEMGVRNMCSLFHMPYLNEAMIKLREVKENSLKDRDIDYIFQYTNVLKEMKVPAEYWNDLSGNNFVNKRLVSDKDLRCTDEDMDLFQKLEQDWGEQFDTLDDYLFLEEKFRMYSNGEELNAPMITMLRYLCTAELDVYKLKKKKAEQKEIDVAEKRVSGYYTKLKLDNFQFKNQKSNTEQIIENFIYTHEKIEPVTWEDENLKDRLGIDADYDDIMRSIGNKVVGTKDYPLLTYDDVAVDKTAKRKKK